MPRARHPSILLVDDVRLFLELEKAFLRRFECEPLTASSGEEALQLIREEQPVLVVLDDKMPGMGGLETCRAIKRDPELNKTKILMASSPGLEPACRDAGADGFVAKPILQEEFVAAVQDLVPTLELRTNRRAFVRFGVEFESSGRQIQAQMRDLSTTGMFVRTEQPLTPGQWTTVRFRLPGLTSPIVVRGEIRNRVAPGLGNLSPGFGLRFLDLAEPDRLRIENYILHLEGGAPHEREPAR